MTGKLIVEARSFAKVLRKAALVVGRYNTIPILSHVRIRHRSGDAVEVSGTDLDRQVTLVTGGESKAGFAVCVEPRRLASLLVLLGSDRVAMEVIGGDLNLTWTDGKARFPTLSADDYPAMKLDGEVRRGRVGSGFVGDVLARVRPAVSTEEVRYYLNGICLDGLDGEPKAVATDGHRLLACNADAGLLPVVSGKSLIVPHPLVGAWMTLLRGQEVEVATYGDLKLQITGDGVELIGKLVDDTYPNWRRVVPKDGSRVFEARRADLQLALHKLAAVGVDGKSEVAIMPGDTLRLQTTPAGGYAGAMETVVSGSAANVVEPAGFSIRYLRDAISATKGETVRLVQKTPADPALVIGSEDDEATHAVVMPVGIVDRDAFARPEALRSVA